MQHRGEIVQQAVKQSGLKVAEVARRLKVVRQTVHNYFHKPDLPLETIQKIGKVIHHDFSDEIRELKGFRPLPEPELEAGDHDATYKKDLKGELYWKEKYYNLLEAFTELLKEKKDDRSKDAPGTAS